MNSKKVAFTLALLAIAVSAANALCLRTVGRHVFNLCPFTNPITIPYNIRPFLNVNVTFSLAKANSPDCSYSSSSSWATAWNIDDDKCSSQTIGEPSFNYTQQEIGLPGLKIYYTLDNKGGDIDMTLLCNQTAPHDANINFFVDGIFDETFKVSGYSYYACPVKADNENLLQF